MTALSVTQSAAAAVVCGLWRYVSVGPLPILPSSLGICSTHTLRLTSHDDDDDDNNYNTKIFTAP